MAVWDEGATAHQIASAFRTPEEIQRMRQESQGPSQHERNPDGVGKGNPDAIYDERNSVKSGVGLVVHLDGITKERTFLFSEGSGWRWTLISGRLTLEVYENGRIALHAPYERVICVSGPQTIFRDGSWK